jgi:tetratricopeptide (TPR) repeat protein
MKHLFFVAVMALTIACNSHIAHSSTPITNATIQNENGQAILAGHCSISSLQQPPYVDWLTKNQEAYVLDSSLLPALQEQLQGKTIKIFLGTWCGDSKREVPRMLKLLQAASIDTANVKLIMVDNSIAKYKQSPQHEEKGKSIHHVPTFIVYENNKELNRIIETPVQSLEKDLLAIVSKELYQPNYKAIAYWQAKAYKQKQIMDTMRLQKHVAAMKPLCKHVGELNAYGYMLLGQKQYNKAINVFRANTLLYPTNSNAFDSLAEAYYTMGNKAKALRYYEKALELQPNATNAKKMIEKIKG